MGISSTGILVLDDDGVRLFDTHHMMSWQIRWTEIVKISAWKDDVFAYDVICMGFLVEGSDKYLWCDEHCARWEQLLNQLQERYNVKLEDRWSRVAFPAFAENFTVIWER